MNILEINDLKKSFNGKKVLDGLSLNVPQNCIYGFVGQNGAGKTTTMKIIMGLMKADAGSVSVCGQNVTFGQNSTNQYVGYLPDVPEFYEFMTPAEYLMFCGDITGMERRDKLTRTKELLELVGLDNYNRRIKGFSRGMKQRLGIAQALLNRPKLLICDEPTSALDPVGRKEILDILVKAKKESTIIFSTHILSDVERICDRVGFLHNGRIVLETDANSLNSQRVCNKVQLEFETNAELEKVLAYMKNNDIIPCSIEYPEANLEDVFMEVIGK